MAMEEESFANDVQPREHEAVNRYDIIKAIIEIVRSEQLDSSTNLDSHDIRYIIDCVNEAEQWNEMGYPRLAAEVLAKADLIKRLKRSFQGYLIGMTSKQEFKKSVSYEARPVAPAARPLRLGP